MCTSVLVVDDHPAIRAALARLLSLSGYNVRSASSGPEAIDAVRRLAPEVAILDVMMPGMCGLEVLAAIRGDPASAGVRVIFYSAADDPLVRREAARLGADDYLVKCRAGLNDLLASVLRSATSAAALAVPPRPDTTLH
ncbi:MAG TPA: response regulator [Humisphaera sp.]